MRNLYLIDSVTCEKPHTYKWESMTQKLMVGLKHVRVDLSVNLFNKVD